MLSQIPKNWDAQKISKIRKSPNKSNSNNTETKRIFSFLKAGGFGFEIVSGEAATTSPYRSFFSSCFGPYLLGVDMSTFPLCVMKIYYACFTMQRYTVHLALIDLSFHLALGHTFWVLICLRFHFVWWKYIMHALQCKGIPCT